MVIQAAIMNPPIPQQSTHPSCACHASMGATFLPIEVSPLKYNPLLACMLNEVVVPWSFRVRTSRVGHAAETVGLVPPQVHRFVL